MGYGHELGELSKRGDIQVCFECDGISTGIPDVSGKGFVRCGACRQRMQRGFGSDPLHPGTGIRSKGAGLHRERMGERLRAFAMRAAEHWHFTVYGVMPERHSYYTVQTAERLIGCRIY